MGGATVGNRLKRYETVDFESLGSFSEVYKGNDWVYQVKNHAFYLLGKKKKKGSSM